MTTTILICNYFSLITWEETYSNRQQSLVIILQLRLEKTDAGKGKVEVSVRHYNLMAINALLTVVELQMQALAN